MTSLTSGMPTLIAMPNKLDLYAGILKEYAIDEVLEYLEYLGRP